MDFVSAARRVADRKDETFFAGNVREGFGHDFFYVGRWSSRRKLRGDAPAAIAMSTMIFFMATPSRLAQICFSFKA
jgi:hypothetical protein